MKKNTKIIIVLLILIIFGLLLFISRSGLLHNFIVDKYYPKYSCGYGTSDPRDVSEVCECKGIKINNKLTGGMRSVCFGKCIDCMLIKNNEE